jgi:16S rRNA (cytosine967-C5)-methyltransferase
MLKKKKQETVALWCQLQAVAAIIQAMDAGRSATASLEKVSHTLRPGVQALTFWVLRHLGRSRALCNLLVSKKSPPAVDALLSSALALLWQGSAYDPFTLVNQCVECAKKTRSTQHHAAFINACLRRFLREQDKLVAQTDRDPVALWNHPAWWMAQLQADWPQDWQAILAANNRQASMVLRINTRRTSVSDYLQRLQDAGLSATCVGPRAIALASAHNVVHLPGFAEGLFSVQDSAAQLAAPLLLVGDSNFKPVRILDACAAPGGKTAHLLELADVLVTAIDIDPLRTERIHDNLNRLGLVADVLTADALDFLGSGELFDAILLDAPCTGSGVVRRHPDIRWLRRPSDIAQLAQIQARLLAQLWHLLQPGGRLLYCTCSVFRAEGADQIAAFLATNSHAKLLASLGYLLPGRGGMIDNPEHDHDGFYYALLEKLAC